MTRRRRTLLCAAAAVACLGAALAALPHVLRGVVEEELRQALRRPVRIGQLRLNPFALSGALRGVRIGEPDGRGTFASFGELYVNVESSSLWRGGLVVGEVRLTDPYVHAVRRAPGAYNFSDLLAPRRPAAKPGRPPRIALGNVQLRGGALDFTDAPLGKEHRVRGLALTLPFLSNFPAYVESFVEPALSCTVDGRTLSVRGQSKPFANSLQTSLAFEVRDLDVPRYLAYAPKPLPVRIPAAHLSARVRVSYAQYRDRGPTLTFAGDAALRDLVLDDPTGGRLLALPLASVTFGPVELFAKSARLTRIRLEAPEVRLASDPRGRWNWAVVAGSGEAKPADPEPARPFAVRLDEAVLAGGRLLFEDGGLATPFRTVVARVDAEAKGLGTAPGDVGTVRLSLATEAGETLAADAALGLAPLLAEGRLKLGELRLARYRPYYGRILAVALDGTLSASTSFSYASGENRGLRIAGLGAALRGFTAARAGEREPFLRLPSLALAGSSADLAGRSVRLGELALRGGELSLRRAPAGRWNVEQLTASSRGTEPPKKAGRGSAPRPWMLDLSRLSVRDLGVAVRDEAGTRPASLSFDRISVDGSNLSTAAGRGGRIAVAAGVNRRGHLSARGALGLAPLAGALEVTASSVDLNPFQAYFDQKLRALVTSGAVSAAGDLTLAPGPAGKPALGYRGSVTVSGFAASDATSGEPLASFESLALTGAQFRQSPLTLKVDGVALADFAASVAVREDGTLNLRDAVQAPPAPQERPLAAAPPSPAEPSPRPIVSVNTVTLQGGRVRFTDRHVKPAYAANLVDLGGRVSGLESEEGRLADVDVRAKLDGAPVVITGKVNPLARSPSVDLKVASQGVDLCPASPYSGRFAGYTVQQGKLFLDVSYRIAERELDARNVLVLDQFYLGEKVDSPEATRLPVKLGLALLRDRNGQIRLDLPVSGSLDDPQFRVGKIVWQALLNVLQKAVLSPFALLASLFDSGPELGYVRFPPGRSELGEDARRTTGFLAKALRERPALTLEIEGRSSPEEDTAALKELFFARKLKAQKAKELVRAGRDVASVDSVDLPPEEVPKYLPLAYAAETFPKPRSALGFEKDVPLEEKEKLLRAHLRVTEDDLGLLARERARLVQDALLGTGLVEPGRLFVVEGKGLGRERDGKVSACRVDFGLQ